MSSLSWIELIYWVSAIAGGTLLILRIIMMAIGAGVENADVDFSAEADVDGVDGADGGEAHAGFKLVSLQGLTAFFMMFGLIGLSLVKANVAIPFTILGGIVAGLFTMAVISFLFLQTKRLQAEGTIDIRNAVGQTASVYLTIQANGSGQVQVVVQGSLKIFDAVSVDKKKIATGEKVRVVAVSDSNTLVVEKN